MVTGERPSDAAARAVEQYMILTIDHGFNASTFTARVVASTGADLADVVGAALGALAGPLHGGAPSRALDAVDAIGDPARTEAWVEAELAAGRRIMGFGHAVYRDRDPRSALLREIALGLQGEGGDLVDRAIEVETRVLATLQRAKPAARCRATSSSSPASSWPPPGCRARCSRRPSPAAAPSPGAPTPSSRPPRAS